MTRRHIIPVIAVTITGLAASSAAARPADGPAYYDAGHASTAVAKAQERPTQDLRSPDTRDAAIRPNLAPVFPTYPELQQRPAPTATATGTDDDSLPVWPIAGVGTLLIGLAGASLVGRRHQARLGT